MEYCILSQEKNVILKMIIWFIEGFFYVNSFLRKFITEKDKIYEDCKIPKVSTRSLVLATFFKPYERILIKTKSGKEYKIFVDADPYTFRNDDDNKFIRTYNELKEMVIEEQSKLSFNKKN